MARDPNQQSRGDHKGTLPELIGSSLDLDETHSRIEFAEVNGTSHLIRLKIKDSRRDARNHSIYEQYCRAFVFFHYDELI